jgi:hypothetical protein
VDVKIYKLLLRQYALATGGVTNVGKLEGVLGGKWAIDPPNLGIRVVNASKYLGMGNDPDMALAAIAESSRQSNGREDHVPVTVVVPHGHCPGMGTCPPENRKKGPSLYIEKGHS